MALYCEQHAKDDERLALGVRQKRIEKENAVATITVAGFKLENFIFLARMRASLDQNIIDCEVSRCRLCVTVSYVNYEWLARR
jgi:hypothetical protein